MTYALHRTSLKVAIFSAVFVVLLMMNLMRMIILGKIRWDHDLILALCDVTGKDPRGFQDTVKKLATDLGVKLHALGS
jgi:hypothetical protein